MSKNSPKEGSMDFEARVTLIQYLVLAVFLMLGIRFYFLQVARHEEYKIRAENNRIRDIPLIAPRGAILDRNGKVLVDNTPAFNIVIYPEDMPPNKEETIAVLVNALGVEREEAEREINNPLRSKSDPILVKQKATDADLAWIAAHQEEHPEIAFETQPQRVYLYGKIACHVLGYIGQISPKQLENPKYEEMGYKTGDIIGQGGLEAYYDKLLRGVNGKRQVVVDSHGRLIRELKRIEPIKGQDLVTTLDIDIQKVAEEQFESKGDTGAAIALDPRNGEILAMASYPNFDPNVFARNVISSENRKEITAILLDPKHPLNNKAIQGFYPAGSTWKIMMSTAAIEAGITPLNNSRLVCGGGLQVGGRFIHCMGNHGAPDVHTALVRSCDGYYYRLGVKMGLDVMKEWLSKFGMGQKTGIDLPHESMGSVPSATWKARVNPSSPEWTDFDSALSGVGQGAVAIPPIQLIRAESGIMMGGMIHTPHFLKEAKATELATVINYEDKSTDLHLSPDTAAAIRYAAWGVVNEGGTGGGIGFPKELNVGGKTGTAQVISKDKAVGKKLQDHSWFISFAPLGKEVTPEIAVVAITENGGFGAKASGPKVKMIHLAYFSKKFGRALAPEFQALVDPNAAAQGATPTSQNGATGGATNSRKPALPKTTAGIGAAQPAAKPLLSAGATTQATHLPVLDNRRRNP
ncbi:MAG: penicillin-binding protein 2 [Acidobacteria bacterium]|nr:penicillin-binding protein 2 [Acidobacteriota bacterium]